MSTVIRATDHNQGVQQPVFNFEDLTVQAERYLERVREEAKKIMVAAHKEADTIKRRAETEGHAAALKKVAEMTEQQLGQKLATLLPALTEVVRQIGFAKHAWLSHWEKSAVHLATAIAGRVVRREVAHQPELPLKLLGEALELAAGSAELRIHLHPTDRQTLGPQAEVLVRELAPLAKAEIVSDPEVSPGGCRVDTRLGIIDQRLESQLARIEEELSEQ